MGNWKSSWDDEKLEASKANERSAWNMEEREQMDGIDHLRCE